MGQALHTVHISSLDLFLIMKEIINIFFASTEIQTNFFFPIRWMWTENTVIGVIIHEAKTERILCR